MVRFIKFSCRYMMLELDADCKWQSGKTEFGTRLPKRILKMTKTLRIP
jgi:hypothetical protein